jgi:hypothetical protein
MIKFFRKIRKKLLNQNNLSKYLLYAVGEIVLVVIGILIALQINNANESRKLEKIEFGYLKRLLIDLEKDQNLWANAIERKKEQLDAIKRIEDIAYFHQDSILSIMDQIPSALAWVDLNPHQTTFNEMLSTGNLDLIKNDSIKIRLLVLNDSYNLETNRIATFKIEYTNSMEAFRNHVSFKNLALVTGNTDFLAPNKMETINNEIRMDLKSLANDKKFINNLIGLRYNYDYQMKTINDLKIKSEHLIEMIQSEINYRIEQ